MEDYQNGKVYRVNVNGSDLVYYGSTVQRLSKRLSQHRCSYKRWLNNDYEYVTVFELLKLGDPYITLVENFSCDSKEQLKSRERYYIENNPCVNKYVPGRTKAEYREDNRDQILEKNKEYYQDNKEKIKEYRDTHKEHKAEYDRDYREKNKDELLENKREYYNNNRDKMITQKAMKIECGCGKEYTYSHKTRHEKTKKHQEWLATQPVESG